MTCSNFYLLYYNTTKSCKRKHKLRRKRTPLFFSQPEGASTIFRSNRTNTPIETTQPYGAPVSGKAADSAYQKLRKKSPRCGEPGGCFANPQARQERQNFGDLARQSVRHPSCTVYKLFPVCDNKIVQDAFLLAGINTVNPDAPIHNCYSALHS